MIKVTLRTEPGDGIAGGGKDEENVSSGAEGVKEDASAKPKQLSRISIGIRRSCGAWQLEGRGDRMSG